MLFKSYIPICFFVFVSVSFFGCLLSSERVAVESFAFDLGSDESARSSQRKRSRTLLIHNTYRCRTQSRAEFSGSESDIGLTEEDRKVLGPNLVCCRYFFSQDELPQRGYQAETLIRAKEIIDRIKLVREEFRFIASAHKSIPTEEDFNRGHDFSILEVVWGRELFLIDEAVKAGHSDEYIRQEYGKCQHLIDYVRRNLQKRKFGGTDVME